MSCSTGMARARHRLLEQLRRGSFAPLHGGDRVGAEAEVIPARESGAPGLGGLRRTGLPLLRRFAETHGWQEEPDYNGAPRFKASSGGQLTFEPGGQIEYSTAPYRRATDLLEDLDRVATGLEEVAAGEGIRLFTVGIDPETPLGAVSLQLESPRYRTMITYLRSLSDAGPRMMLQTAAFQLNVDFGPQPALRWWVLNAAAPYLTAIFANSAVYAGQATGYRSFRALQWRELDPARTGVFSGAGDPVPAYMEFALGATHLFRKAPAGAYRSFEEWLDRGKVTLDDWDMHVSTLFPEIRPKGYMEIRCIDALPTRWYPAPVVLVTGLTRPRALAAALDLLPPPDDDALRRAARHGVRDPAIQRTADALFEIALDAAAPLERDIGGANIETAREFRERYTRRGRAPADDTGVAAVA